MANEIRLRLTLLGLDRVVAGLTSVTSGIGRFRNLVITAGVSVAAVRLAKPLAKA